MVYVFHQFSSGRGPLWSSMEAMLEALNADWCAGSYFTTFCEQSGNQVLQHHSRYIWCLSQYEALASKCNWINIFIVLCWSSCGRMRLTFGLTCRTTVSCFIRMDWILTESREKHRSAHTQEPLQWAHFCVFFLNFTVFAQSAHFFKR